jgi:hypothetical protein
MCRVLKVLCLFVTLSVAAPVSAEERREGEESKETKAALKALGCKEEQEAQAPQAPKVLTAEELEAEDRMRGLNEVILFHTFHGIVLFEEIRAVVGFDYNIFFLIPTLFAGGVIGATIAGEDGITRANAQALNAGLIWTAVNVEWTLARARDESLFGGFADEDPLSKNTLLWVMLGQTAGVGVGELYYRLLDPTPGQVALSNSGGIWFTVGTFFLQRAVPRQDELFDSVTLQLAMNAGLVTGTLVANYFPMSRFRALVLDGGAVLGLFSGFMVTGMSGVDIFGSSSALYHLGGLSLGIATAAYLTRDWDDDRDAQNQLAPTVSLVPGDSLYTARGERQGGWGLSASWAW